MNLYKAREAYEHDPPYHNLVDGLVQQIEMLQMSPSEIREAAMFACLIIEERNKHPLMIVDLAEVEQRCTAEQYRRFVLGEWDLSGSKEKPEVRVMLACKECHEAMMPGSVCGVCTRCLEEIEAVWL